MRKFFLLFLFINFYIVVYNQIIQGTIFDAETKSTIPYAAIYISGTFVGAISDQDGTFELDVTKYASKPITISAIGYYSNNLTDFPAGKPIEVCLTPKIYEIPEVTVSAKSLIRERKANLKLFKNEFLGTTFNARNCEITNENDITFNYGLDKDTLKAFALKPILIDNITLGYEITYYLDKFEYFRKSNTIFFTGSIIFTRDLATDETREKLYESKRKNAYLGSRMHFFRALWENDLKSNKFTVKNSEKEELRYKDIVIQKDDNEKYLTYSGNLDIYYDYSPWYYLISKIILLKEQVLFEKDGYFDPSGILWEGPLAEKRIADWLPYEYSIE